MADTNGRIPSTEKTQRCKCLAPLCRLSPATTCPALWRPRTSAYGRTCCPTLDTRAISPGTTPASSRRRATAAGTEAWPHATKPPSTPPTPEPRPPTDPTPNPHPWNPLPPPWCCPILITSRVLLWPDFNLTRLGDQTLRWAKKKRKRKRIHCSACFVALLIENNTFSVSVQTFWNFRH